MVWFVIAWLVLRADVASLATVGVLVGIAFVITAVNEAGLGALMTGGWAVAHYALSVVFVLGAAWAFVRPVEGSAPSIPAQERRSATGAPRPEPSSGSRL